MTTIAGIKPLPLMQWRTQFYNRDPKVRIAGEEEVTSIVDGLVVPVAERWCYVIAETADRQTAWEIIEEGYVDDRGRYHKVLGSSPYAPIQERNEPSKRAPKHSVAFPKFRLTGVGPMAEDATRDPLWIRLLFAPFRLPSTATRLLGERFRDLLGEHVRPLWDWKKGHDPRSPLNIIDSAGQEWAFDATPLWRSNDSSLPALDKFKPVAVGFDPFTVAENLSDDYVRACKAMKTEFERPNAPTGSNFQKMALVDLIENTVLASPEGKKRYSKALDISKQNKAFKRRKRRRKRLVAARERTGGELCKVLASPFVWLYQQASFATEGLDEAALAKKNNPARSPQIDAHIRWLSLCTQSLNESLAGRALLDKWVEDSSDHPDHFVNQLVLPKIVPPVHYFKSFRWGSKGIASVLSQFLSHKVAKRRAWTAMQFTDDVLIPLAKLAEIGGEDGWHWFKDGTFDPTKHIKGIGVAGDVIKQQPIDLNYLTVDVQVSLQDIETVETLVIERKGAKFVSDWIDAGEFKDFGRASRLLDAKLLGTFLLDAINVSLALNSAREQLGKDGQIKAFADLGISALSLTVNVLEVYYQGLGLSQKELLKAGRTFSIVRGVAGAYYATTNFLAAVDAFKNADTDYGAAMYLAAGLEATAAAATFYTALTVGSSLGPWVGVIAGLLAAATYVIAGLLKDDELERFLLRCEFGKEAYLDFTASPKWASVAPEQWKNDYSLQQRFLLRILSQVSVEWAKHGNAVLGVTISTQMLCPDSRLAVDFVGTLASGETLVDPFVIEGSDLPKTLPGSITRRPSRTLNDWTHPSDLRAVVRFQLTPDSATETIVFPLIVGNVDQPDDRISNV